MCTSSGRYFSKAAFSGALTDVWPATTALYFVAEIQQSDRGNNKIKREDLSSQGPYCATTESMNSASTEYIMKSEVRDTR